jgi:hypothetical protein
MLQDPSLRKNIRPWVGYVHRKPRDHWDPFAAQVIYSRYTGRRTHDLPYAFRSDYLKRVRTISFESLTT